MSNDQHSGAQGVLDRPQNDTAIDGSSTDAFIKNAALGDLYEIQAGEIAKRRAGRHEVRQLAEEMIKDHRKVSGDLKSTLQSAQPADAVTPPAELDTRHQGLIDNLEAAPQDEFDKTYVEQQLIAHEEATTLYRNYCDNGDNPQIQSFAKQTLPVLEQHAQQVKKLHEDIR